MTDSPRTLFRFGPFVLDPANRRLTRDDQPMAITGRPFDILVALVRRPGELIDKGTLIDQVWGDTAVEEGNLARNVSTLRKVLGDDSDTPQYVATIPGRGYQFVAPVEVVSAVRPEATAPVVTSTQAPAPAATERRVRRVSPVLLTVAATLAVIAAIAVITIVWTRNEQRAIVRVLVLPFENLTGSGSEDPVADGLTEETIVELGRLDPSRVLVVARTTAMTFKGTRPSLEALKGMLDVDFVVEGSLRRDADTYRTTTQLVDVARGVPVWSQSFDRATSDLLFVQQDLASAIGRQVRIEVTSDTAARLARVRTTNFEAHREYLAGRHALALGTEADIRRAIEGFERAVAIDPGYALAHTGLADAAVALTDYYVSPEETRATAKRAAQRAVDLEGSLAEAHASLGTVRLLFEWNWPEAEREFQRAIALQPGYADAHSWYGYYLALMGRADEAVAEVQVAETLDPRSVFMQLNASWVYFLARKPGEAVAHVTRALEIDPSASVTHSSLWAAYAPVTEFVLKATGDPGHATPLGLATLAGATATAGRSAEAEGILQRLQTAEGYVCPYEIACAKAALGKRDEAFRYLEKSYAERSPCLPDLKVDPRFDTLRNDPRMASLLGRMNLR